MTRTGAVILATLVALPLLVSPVSAQVVRTDRASMRGLTDFEIVVEDLIPGAQLDGLTKDHLLEAVENRLRLAGFVLAADSTGGGGYLYVNVNMTVGSGIYIYCAELQLRQATRLVRAPDQAVPEAVTWQTGVVAAVPATELRVGITSVVLGEVDTFIRDYAEENPGTVTVPPQPDAPPPA